MGRWRNLETGTVFSVSDDKDGRYGHGYEPADESGQKPASRRAAAEKPAASKPKK